MTRCVASSARENAPVRTFSSAASSGEPLRQPLPLERAAHHGSPIPSLPGERCRLSVHRSALATDKQPVAAASGRSTAAPASLTKRSGLVAKTARRARACCPRRRPRHTRHAGAEYTPPCASGACAPGRVKPRQREQGERGTRAHPAVQRDAARADPSRRACGCCIRCFLFTWHSRLRPLWPSARGSAATLPLSASSFTTSGAARLRRKCRRATQHA